MERHKHPFTVKDLQQTKEYVNYRETQKTTRSIPVHLSNYLRGKGSAAYQKQVSRQ